MVLIRLACGVYILLTVFLLLTPDPLAILGFPSSDVSGSNFLAHFGLFLLLTLMVCLSRFHFGLCRTGGILVGYALATETLQWWVPRRTVDPRDYAANLLGIAAGLTVWWFFFGRRQTDSDSTQTPASESTATVTNP